jgi:hypothetical protein
MTEEAPARVVAVNRGTENAGRQASGRGPRHDALEVWVGRWINVGGMEIIGYDEASGGYRSHFFDSQGNVTVSSLVARGDTWTYQGDTTRSTVEFSDDHRVQTVLHERTDDGTSYRPSMRVTLRKVA